MTNDQSNMFAAIPPAAWVHDLKASLAAIPPNDPQWPRVARALRRVNRWRAESFDALDAPVRAARRNK